MTQTEERTKRALKALSQAIQESLQRKRLLGQYAVMGESKMPSKVPADQLPDNK
ncbi:MAG: hypothetical protein GXP22_03035 [Gammaproteobacteria bacterium]|nr:hypothetical protein [Gammaproteobacteria bacterium]